MEKQLLQDTAITKSLNLSNSPLSSKHKSDNTRKDSDIFEIYRRDNVFIHPKGLKEEGIPGYILIYSENQKSYYSWVPYYVIDAKSNLPKNPEETKTETSDLNSYGIKVLLNEIQSITRRIPSMGISSVTLVLKKWHCIPTILFYFWWYIRIYDNN